MERAYFRGAVLLPEIPSILSCRIYFSQETNEYEIAHLLRLTPEPVVLVLFLPPLWSPSAGG